MTQRAPLTQAEKQRIREEKKAGKNLRQIGEELHCSEETTRKWWRMERDQRQPHPRGRPKRGPVSSYPPIVNDQAIKIKKGHPHWGPKMVRIELAQVLSLRKDQLPSPARLSVLFKARCPEAVQPHQKRLLPVPEGKVKAPHQRWQMDAKEGIPLGTERVNVQEICDIYTGLKITSQAFVTTTATYFRHLSRAEHQDALRRAFSQWGLPLELQTDNDSEFVNHTDPTFPSHFTLWLIGLGVTHCLSRPHRPTDQPQVERNHRTQGDFVWKDQAFEKIDVFQQALDHHCQLYNQEYPSLAAHCQGIPPLSAFPTAYTTGRPYHPAEEWHAFDLQRVDTFLAKFVWTRKVARNGAVHIAGISYLLSAAYKSKLVSVRFLPASRSFRFESADGSFIKDLPAQGLEKEHLIGLIPVNIPLPVGFQFPLPLQGV
jgi:transposase InsO family protein